jgi:hypothetical protein
MAEGKVDEGKSVRGNCPAPHKYIYIGVKKKHSVINYGFFGPYSTGK